jgi:hypothetical protein
MHHLKALKNKAKKRHMEKNPAQGAVSRDKK